MKNIVLECTPNDKKAAVVEFWRIDMRFNVEPVNGGYQIKNQHLASANYQLHEGVRNRFFSSFPLSASDGSTREWFDNRGHGSAIYRIADVKNSEWKNRPCIEVRSEWDNKHGIVNYGSTFLDPDHDYITIGSEGDWTVDPINKYRRKVYQEIEYSPSTDGYLLPKSARRYIRKENGPEIKIYDIDFLSYERYFPSEDEFKLEGPYKLTTPAFMPVSSNPALETTPARRARWPWILFAIAAILAIPSVYYLWRSRKASRQITGSQIMKLDKK
ncbi:MAG TPA: hypothetical protein VG097_17795 [Gemmata sp.]|nr:hypothetical protein [Gemmata sp.]